jgi:hypothetical protein
MWRMSHAVIIGKSRAEDELLFPTELVHYSSENAYRERAPERIGGVALLAPMLGKHASNIAQHRKGIRFGNRVQKVIWF